MKKLLLVLCMLLLAACDSDEEVSLKDYSGEQLKIAIIGDTQQNLGKNNVSFETIDFEKLKTLNNKTEEYDAIFITKKYFGEASKAEYAEIYNQSTIPIFFIESTKSHMPFTIAELTYDQSVEVDALSYMTGFLTTSDGYQSWEFGLENDKKNEDSIRDVYIEVFTLIEDIKLLKNG